MIIFGYPGVGKSTLGGTDKFIDLDSSNFWVDGFRNLNWYKEISKIAISISEQGFNVLLPTHQLVRDEVISHTKDVLCVFPSMNLKDMWVQKLKDRYEQHKSAKNFKAYEYAESKYIQSVLEMERWCNNNDVPYCRIDEQLYDLTSIISKSCGSNAEVDHETN